MVQKDHMLVMSMGKPRQLETGPQSRLVSLHILVILGASESRLQHAHVFEMDEVQICLCLGR